MGARLRAPVVFSLPQPSSSMGSPRRSPAQASRPRPLWERSLQTQGETMSTDPQSQQPQPQPPDSDPSLASTPLPNERPSSSDDDARSHRAEQEENDVDPHSGRDSPLPPSEKGSLVRYDELAAATARGFLQAYKDASKSSQAKLAHRLGVDQSAISRVLSGELQPSAKLLIGLRRATGRSIDELLGLTPPTAAVPNLDLVLAELAEIKTGLGLGNRKKK